MKVDTVEVAVVLVALELLSQVEGRVPSQPLVVAQVSLVDMVEAQRLRQVDHLSTVVLVVVSARRVRTVRVVVVHSLVVLAEGAEEG